MKKDSVIITISLLHFILWTTVCSAQTLEEVLGYGLPVVVVNTVDGEEPTAERIEHPEGCMGTGITNVTKVPGRVRVYYPCEAEVPVFDSGEYVEGVSGMTFKIRGNTSAAGSNKKPFKIKLQKKADLLMRGDSKFKDKDWALIKPPGVSVHHCPIITMVGNKITEALRVCNWVPASIYVNLIVNDNYRGFYQLTETVKRNDKCRIDVDEQTGYIAEIDPYWWNGEVNFVESPILKSSYKFTFKYPDSDDITEEQLDAFRRHIEQLEASLGNGTYPQHIDVESCARWLLAHQLLGTFDAGGSNMFIIRHDDQSRFQMGTLWDFDSAFNVQGSFTPIMSLHYFKQMLQKSPCKMLACEMVWIWETERERIMAEISDYIESLVGTDFAQAIDLSIQANGKRWPGNVLDDMGTTIGKLRQWFATRNEDMNDLLPTLDIDDDILLRTEMIEDTFIPYEAGARKVVRDKHLYIIKDNKTYTIDGKRMK